MNRRSFLHTSFAAALDRSMVLYGSNLGNASTHSCLHWHDARHRPNLKETGR